jgi:uncharacterized protein YjbI with pentapeptide repeats
MSEFLQQRVEKIRLWAKDPDHAASRTLVVLLIVLILVTIALWIVWIIPKHQVRNSFGSYLNADIAKQTELETARRTNTDKSKHAEIEAQLNANATQIRADSEKALELEDNFRKTLTQIVLSIFGLFILYFTWQSARAGGKTVQIMEQGHITDRFTKAIEQLGKFDGDKPNIEVRLGGIYALERIAHDSPRDHWTIMEVLTAYVRQNAPATPPGVAPEKPPPEKPCTDIQAILTVLRRRLVGTKREHPDQRIDLSSTHLQGAYLENANLRHSNFYKASLQDANLRHANLQGANLRHAKLQSARLSDANLQGAHLSDADLQRAADLRDANLQGADLTSAKLQGADLSGAKLQGAVLRDANLQGADLTSAKLQGANLRDASLQGTILRQANLQGVYLTSANMQDTNLRDANLRGADLTLANLQGARNLTPDQIRSAAPSEETHYSPDLRAALGLPLEDQAPTPSVDPTP